MNIKRIINRNGKLIFYGILIIICIFLAIKLLDRYYQKDEERKREQVIENASNKKEQEEEVITKYTTESDSVKVTLASFVNYCNKRELGKAYGMLTEECKKAMFPTIEDFENIYINKVYNVERTFNVTKWSVNGNKSTYLVKLYGDLLSTGGSVSSTEEYYTFVEGDDGTYKINVNNYIYGEERNIEKNSKGVNVKINYVDVYEEFEKVEIVITNNTNKEILLNEVPGDDNIYLLSSQDVIYSSLNSLFDNERIIMSPNSSQTFLVDFNKVYSVNNNARYLVLNNIILDYQDYFNSENKEEYGNKISIKVDYKK